MEFKLHTETPKQLKVVAIAMIIGLVFGIIVNWPEEDPYKSIRPSRPLTPTNFKLKCSTQDGANCTRMFNGYYYVAATYYTTASDGTKVYSQLGRVSVQELKSKQWNEIHITDTPVLPEGVDGIAYYIGSTTGFFYQMSQWESTDLPTTGSNIWSKEIWKTSRSNTAQDYQRMTYNTYKFGFKPLWAIIPAVLGGVIACLYLTIKQYFF